MLLTRTSVAHYTLIICTLPSTFRPPRTNTHRTLRPLVVLAASSVWYQSSPGLRSTLKYARPLITSDRQASTAMRTPAVVAMETKKTLLLTLTSPLAPRRKGCSWKQKELGNYFDLNTPFPAVASAKCSDSDVVKASSSFGYGRVAYPPSCRLYAAVSTFYHI